MIVAVLCGGSLGLGQYLGSRYKITNLGFENIGELATQAAYCTEVNVTEASREFYGITIPFTGDLFSFYIFDWIHLWTLVPFALAAWGMMWGFGKLTQKGIDRWELHEQKKLKSDSLSEPSNVFQEKT